MSVTNFVNGRRLLLAAPLLAAAGLLIYVLVGRSDASATPRAALAETPPGAVEKIGVREGQLARDFVATAPNGAVVRLSELRGRPVLINFWATWCTSCLAELPEFKSVQAEVGADNLAVLALNAGEDGATAQRFLDELRADAFHIGMDPSLVVADAYGVIGLPTSIFLDAEGVVRGIYTGHIGADDLRTFLASAQANRTAPEPPPKLRLVTTVARDHVLEVRAEGGDRLDLRSKSLRCDDTYCAADAIDVIRRAPGVLTVDEYTGEDPARIEVTFEPQVTDVDDIAQALASALGANPDPLYERPLEIVRK